MQHYWQYPLTRVSLKLEFPKMGKLANMLCLHIHSGIEATNCSCGQDGRQVCELLRGTIRRNCWGDEELYEEDWIQPRQDQNDRHKWISI
ncbi:MAG: hypothetical protein EZS28_012370 [Streblomastix strix]|uniref:Uncharacterized protein n=1 Tax=Streblomastix strix TaxID=222440 RepID=A0A5J4WC17_9EUKA|nr:MAG: hypothetical protein EZS28_012370 [Streblomastix strix]